jgi:hypothetical protein
MIPKLSRCLCGLLAVVLVGISSVVGQGTSTQACSTSSTADTAATAEFSAPVPIICDTDFAGDVDDAGALAILHALADQGEAEILAVMVSSSNRFAFRAVDAVNTYYGRPDIPVGMVWGSAVNVSSEYTFELAYDFPNDIVGASNAVDLYRQILAEQPDHSATIVSVGFLTNLRNLLYSEPDAHSSFSGAELVEAKVRQWVVMGGHYPDSADHPEGREYNFAMDAQATFEVIPDWPTPIVFSGFELGVDIETGAVFQTATPPENPVREAYRLFNQGRNRSSWDLTAVHYAVRGRAGVWELCSEGLNEVFSDGSNVWWDLPDEDHAYLVNAVPKSDIERMLDDLLIQQTH